MKCVHCGKEIKCPLCGSPDVSFLYGPEYIVVYCQGECKDKVDYGFLFTRDHEYVGKIGWTEPDRMFPNGDPAFESFKPGYKVKRSSFKFQKKQKTLDCWMEDI